MISIPQKYGRSGTHQHSPNLRKGMKAVQTSPDSRFFVPIRRTDGRADDDDDDDGRTDGRTTTDDDDGRTTV